MSYFRRREYIIMKSHVKKSRKPYRKDKKQNLYYTLKSSKESCPSEEKWGNKRICGPKEGQETGAILRSKFWVGGKSALSRKLMKLFTLF